MREYSLRPGEENISQKDACMLVKTYLHGCSMHGESFDYAYFGHQSGLDYSECFLDEEGGIVYAYFNCRSDKGFEPCRVPYGLWQMLENY